MSRPRPAEGARVVGLFGGSFDPIHNGHLIVAQVAAESLGVDEMRMVVAREQPLKRAGHGASSADRAAMVSLAIAGIPRFTTETLELDRPAPSYTIETLRLLREREPASRFVLLLGADTLPDLPRWREADQLPALATLVVLTRSGVAAPPSPLVSRVLEVPAIGISATAVRERIRRGQPVAGWIPDQVAQYIAHHRLYLPPP